jgi:3',5'-cyclic AMP phosphodiesterase CpdA
VIVAHLSDLHLRTGDDAAGLARQLDRIDASAPDHLVITGDLLDRWDPAILEHALDLLARRSWLHPDRTTIIHGNHDLASSGGYPRGRADLWRLVARSWDPPPLLIRRRREFYRRIARRAPRVGLTPMETKTIGGSVRLVTLDSVPALWAPVGVSRAGLTLRQGEGRIPDDQTDWLAALSPGGPLVVLTHHYPLPVGAFIWDVGRVAAAGRLLSPLRRTRVMVAMEIAAPDRERFWRAAADAKVAAVLCGHVHRARLERHGGTVVGLNGQSGADWAGRTIAYYRIDRDGVAAEYDSAPGQQPREPR